MSADGLHAKCPFCGATQVLHQPAEQFDRLKDFPNASFDVRYAEPQLSLEQAKAALIEKVSADPIGSRDIDELNTTAEGLYLPAWYVECEITCDWTGKYTERRTVTQYRPVTKYRTVVKNRWGGGVYSVKEKYTDQEPYSTEEVIWHLCSGNRTTRTAFRLSANADLPLDARRVLQALSLDGTKAGFVPPLDGFDVLPALVSQREAWEAADCREAVDAAAQQACEGDAEAITSVSAKLDQIHFNLVYLPFAVLRCRANETDYVFHADLSSGGLWGEAYPLDHNAIDTDQLTAAARTAYADQQGIRNNLRDAEATLVRERATKDRALWLWAYPIIAVALLAGLSVHAIGSADWTYLRLGIGALAVAAGLAVAVAGIRRILSARTAKADILAKLPAGSPWKRFLETNRVALLRAQRIAIDQSRVSSPAGSPDRQEFADELETLRRLEESNDQTSLQTAETIAYGLIEATRLDEQAVVWSGSASAGTAGLLVGAGLCAAVGIAVIGSAWEASRALPTEDGWPAPSPQAVSNAPEPPGAQQQARPPAQQPTPRPKPDVSSTTGVVQGGLSEESTQRQRPSAPPTPLDRANEWIAKNAPDFVVVTAKRSYGDGTAGPPLIGDFDGDRQDDLAVLLRSFLLSSEQAVAIIPSSGSDPFISALGSDGYAIRTVRYSDVPASITKREGPVSVAPQAVGIAVTWIDPEPVAYVFREDKSWRVLTLADQIEDGADETDNSGEAEVDTGDFGLVTGDSVRIRKGPGTSYDVIGAANKGDIVAVLEPYPPTGEWIRIRHDDTSGWMHRDYVDVGTSARESPSTPSSSPPAQTKPPEPKKPKAPTQDPAVSERARRSASSAADDAKARFADVSQRPDANEDYKEGQRLLGVAAEAARKGNHTEAGEFYRQAERRFREAAPEAWVIE